MYDSDLMKGLSLCLSKYTVPQKLMCCLVFVAPDQLQCALHIITAKFGEDEIAAVHKGSTLEASCQCNIAPSLSLFWSRNNVYIDDNPNDIIITYSPTEIYSVIKIEHIFQELEGSESLCCGYNDSVTACLPFEVVRQPVFTISYLSDVGCRTNENDNGTEMADVMCALTSPIEDYIFGGYMVLYRNSNGTKFYDPDPIAYSGNDTLRRLTWAIAFNFTLVEVHNHDILHCRWVQDYGSQLLSKELEVAFGKCSVPTVPVRTTAAYTTTVITETLSEGKSTGAYMTTTADKISDSTAVTVTTQTIEGKEIKYITAVCLIVRKR